MRIPLEQIKKKTHFISNIIFYLFLIICLVHQIHSTFFLIDIIGNLGKQIFIGGILLLLFYFFLNRYFLSLFLIIILIVFYVYGLYPCDNCVAKLNNNNKSEIKLKLMSFNTGFYRSNKNFEKEIKKAVLDENIDIILFQDLATNNLNNLNNLKNIFPYGTDLENHINPWGSVILSKFPIKNFDRDYDVSESRFLINNEKITIIGVHLYHPGSQKQLDYALEQINYLKELTNDIDGHLIIMGDLNMTSTSRRFINFLEETNMYTYSSLINMTSTWPSFLPNIIAIQIDHIIYSSKFRLKQKKILNNFTSDHKPIIFELHK